MQWDGPFRQLVNSQVESGFADHRTYLHDGDEIDHQVHLGFDLASTANAPVLAANSGTVVIREGGGQFRVHNHSSGVDFAAAISLGDGSFLLVGEDGVHKYPESDNPGDSDD